jgi:hypothetical protein
MFFCRFAPIGSTGLNFKGNEIQGRNVYVFINGSTKYPEEHSISFNFSKYINPHAFTKLKCSYPGQTMSELRIYQ